MPQALVAVHSCCGGKTQFLHSLPEVPLQLDQRTFAGRLVNMLVLLCSGDRVKLWVHLSFGHGERLCVPGPLLVNFRGLILFVIVLTQVGIGF